MKIKRLVLQLLLLLCSFYSAQAQLSPEQQEKINQLFLDWNQPNHPGGAVGIMQEEEVIFSKAYGLASMEYLVPNSTGTLFNIASVSKQFTSMGILLLEAQGKLSIDADVREYLPYLPKFKHKVTIRHFMHHTSGMRSLHAMLQMAGWRDDDSRTNADLVRFMKNQKELNFEPGSEYLYCNTGYILMSEIIEKITGEKFPAWMRTTIFEPLGMIDSYVEEDYSRVVPNNATSYNGSANRGFNRAVEYWGYIGSGNMHCSTSDLLKWLRNFYAPKAGWEAAFQKLQTLDPLNNGEKLNYAFGVVVDSINNSKRISHGGSIGGFRAHASCFPDKKLSLVILSNFSNSGLGSKVSAINDLLLSTDKPVNELASATPQMIKAMPVSTGQLANYSGHYWNDQAGYSRKIYVKNDTLRYARSATNETALVPVAKDKFQMLGASVRMIVEFQSTGATKKSMLVSAENAPPTRMEYYEPIGATSALLQNYIGSYYSPELETSYRIEVVDNQLMGHHARHGDFDIKVLRENDLEATLSPFRRIKVKRNAQGEVKGLLVTNGRVRNLWFERTVDGPRTTVNEPR